MSGLLAYICHRASLKLAYKDLSLEEKKRDESMKKMDPQKKAQMERLGMGFAGSRWVPVNMQSIAHSHEAQT